MAPLHWRCQQPTALIKIQAKSSSHQKADFWLVPFSPLKGCHRRGRPLSRGPGHRTAKTSYAAERQLEAWQMPAELLAFPVAQEPMLDRQEREPGPLPGSVAAANSAEASTVAAEPAPPVPLPEL
mmetsp:Transcript_126478/g.219280  ORF Transcript_126478/g.219280 Transcript_126478/m.219280 type:complete len:125 (-) Transcript_126478:2086-2460(-)